jgi:monoamine oxidase
MEQTIRTEYGVEPPQSSALQLLFLLPTVEGRRVDPLGYSDEEFTVDGGSGRVIDGLAAVLRGQIVTGAPLRRLAADGVGYPLVLGKHEVRADYVVLALPFMTLRDVDVQAPLPPLLRACIRELDLGRDEKLFAGFSRKPWRRPGGFAMDLWTDAGFAEAWDDTQSQPDHGRGVLNFFAGGAQVDRLFAESTKAAGDRYVAILERAFPGSAAAATGRYLRTTWSRQRYTRGGYTSFAPGQYTRFAPFRWVESPHPAERQEVRVGNLVFAGEHTSDEWYGFMNGGAQTGRLAAESILRSLHG